MFKLQHWLPILAIFFIISSQATAQTDIVVEIIGVDGELASNVRLFLSIEQQKTHPLMSEGRLQRLHKKAPKEIIQALQPYGYYKPEIGSVLIQSDGGKWRARYTIDPGPVIPLAAFDFRVSGEMQEDAVFLSFMAKPPLRRGQAFNHLKYEAIKTGIAKIAAERGYFNGHFSVHRVVVDLDVYEVRVQLHYDSGPRYYFGAVSLQQEVLATDLLRRYIPFESGAPYTLVDLIDLQQALNNSDYFDVVEVFPGELRPDSREVPVNVSLTPRKRHHYTLGLGYGTDTGARAKLGWEMPRLNSQGHRLDTEIKLSQIGRGIFAHYRVPVLNPRTDQMVYTAGAVNEKTDTHESTVHTVGVTLNHGRGPWRESFSLNYQREEFTVADEQGRSTLLMPGVSWTRTWGKGFVRTLDGIRFDIAVRGANEHLVSDADFVQIQGGLKGITSLGSRSRLIARGRLGSTMTPEFHQLPSSVRFFAGGSQSVRGYAYQSLGPLNDEGQVVGGQHLMTGSLEFEHKINGKWSAAMFYDAGNAIDDMADKLAWGAGLGVRWQSPVGAVRFDLASALSQEGRPWRVHINIGPDL